MIRSFRVAAALAALSIVSACGQSQAQIDQCLQSGNPQECAQVRDAGGNVSDYLMYGLGGYMIGHMMGGRSYMMRNPGYHGAYQPIPSYANSYGYVSRPGYRPYSVVHHINAVSYPTHRVTTTTTSRSGLFGRRTTTTTTTRSMGGSYYRPSTSSPYTSGRTWTSSMRSSPNYSYRSSSSTSFGRRK